MTWTSACRLGLELLASAGPAYGRVDAAVMVPASGTSAIHLAAPPQDDAQAGRRPSLAAEPAPPALLSDDALGASRAGQTTVTGTQTLKAVTTSNTVNGNLVAGSITLSGNALSKFTGVGNFAINSGSQVSIQSGMNLTVSVTK